MATLKKYNLSSQELGNVMVDDAFAQAEANGQMIKDYIVALRANARQWSANTRGRSEINHSTQKPHRQKGTGNARQGSLAAPQYKGGGKVFGPKPKFDQHVRINRKERRQAIKCLLAQKIRENNVVIVPDHLFNPEKGGIAAPKTKIVADFLKAHQVYGRHVLFVGECNFAEFEADGFSIKINIRNDQHQNFMRSIRNIPRAQFQLASNLNGYDILVAHKIIFTESAFAEIQNLLA